MSHLSLPEERAKMGKVSGLDREPINLLPHMQDLEEDWEKAEEIHLYGGSFTREQRDRIIARLVLKL